MPLINVHISDSSCEYQNILVELTSPGALPPGLRTSGAAYRVVDPVGRPLLNAAVSYGTFLYLEQIKSILGSLPDVPHMQPGTGSGKNGRFVKVDFAIHLTKYIFPEASPEEVLVMVKRMCFSGTPGDEVDDSILDYLDALDSENQEAFADMKRMAKEARENKETFDMTKVREKLGLGPKSRDEDPAPEPAREAAQDKKRPERAASVERPSGSRGPKRAKVTPPQFRDLFTPDMQAKMFFYHDRDKQNVRVSYPGRTLVRKVGIRPLLAPYMRPLLRLQQHGDRHMLKKCLDSPLLGPY